MKDNLASKSIEELSTLIGNKQISPVEVTESVLERIGMFNSSLNAYISVYADEAIESAKQAESEILRGQYRGPLHGIPVAFKDNIYVEGKTVTMGSKIYKEHIAGHDATVVTRLKDAGVIIVGKLNLNEFAIGMTGSNQHFGSCHNPWDLNRISGGSSSGSAVAVAADMVIAALGTDTGGSIRIPASLCGIVGLKPTFGLVSTHGVFPCAWTLDHVGPMTKTVKDAAFMLEVIAEDKKIDFSKLEKPVYTENLREDLKEKVIGLYEDYIFSNIDSGVEKIICDGIETLQKLGAEVRTISIPSLKHTYYAATMTIWGELSTVHYDNLRQRIEEYGDEARRTLLLGEMFSAVDYLQAQRVRKKMIEEFNNVFKNVDVVITPTLPFTAPEIGKDYALISGRKVKFYNQFHRFISFVNLVGLPSMTINCGFSNGLPVGLQIIGNRKQEQKIIEVGYAFERARPFYLQNPKIIKGD